MGAITDCAAVRTLRPKGNALNRVITLNKQSGGPAFGALFASASRIPKRPRTRSLQEPHKTASSSSVLCHFNRANGSFIRIPEARSRLR